MQQYNNMNLLSEYLPKLNGCPNLVGMNDNFCQMKHSGPTSGIKVLMITSDNMNAANFFSFLDIHCPSLIIETRTIPDFFGVYEDTELATRDFVQRGIEYAYIPIPLNHRVNFQEIQENENQFKAQLESHLRIIPLAPVCVLLKTVTSIPNTKDVVTNWVMNVIPNVHFIHCQ